MRSRAPYSRFLVMLVVLTIIGMLNVFIVNAVIDPFDIYKFKYLTGINEIKSEIGSHVRLNKAHAVKRLEPEAVILGTSRAEFGLDPDHVGWREDAVPRYNLGLPDASAYEMRRYLEHANAVGNLKQVVIGLDFMSFNIYKQPQADFSEDRLAVDVNGRSQHKWWSDIGSTLLSADALLASWATVRNQTRTGYPQFLTNGQREWDHNWEIIQAKGGHRRMFHYNERRFMSEMWFPLPRNAFRLNDRKTGRSALDEIATILHIARQNNIELYMYISPAHARMWESMKVAGLWQKFEQWKRDLVAIIDGDAIRHPNQMPVELWDFSGANSVTTEAVPAQGDDQTQMNWYWEASHFNKKVGDMVLNRIFSINEDEVPDDFGLQLVRENIERILAEQATAQEEYAAMFSDDAKEVLRQAEETQSARFCSAFLWQCE